MGLVCLRNVSLLYIRLKTSRTSQRRLALEQQFITLGRNVNCNSGLFLKVLFGVTVASMCPSLGLLYCMYLSLDESNLHVRNRVTIELCNRYIRYLKYLY